MRRAEWILLLVVFVVQVGYQFLLFNVDAMRTMIDDEKGLSGMFIVLPVVAYVCAMVSAYRWGFRFWRPVLLAVVTTIAFVVSVPEAFGLTSPRDWGALAVSTLIYFVPAIVGEGIGTLIRRWRSALGWVDLPAQ